MSIELSFGDGLIIFIYMAIVLVLGFYYPGIRNKDTKSYFLCNKNLGWFAIGMSIFATNISSEHFIGLAGSGATKGLVVGQFELMAIFILILLGWIIAPIIIKSGVTTVPEFLGLKFGEKNRKFLAGFSIVVYIFTKITVSLFAGGFLFSKLFGVSIYTSAIIIVLFTGLYSVIGGSIAVIRTNVFQGIVFITGAVLLTIFGLKEVGGITGLKESLPSTYFSMFKSLNNPDFPWTGIIFGAPILAFWYWITDQYIVQRIISAKNINTARTGSLFAASLKILPIFILVLPGLIAAALYPGVSGDDAFPLLLSGSLLPVGVKGIVLAGLLAAIMSSLASVFNVSATLFTNDYYKIKNPYASETKLVLIGRLATTVIVVIAILCVPLVKFIPNQLYLFLQGLQSYIAPPIAAVFLFGFLYKKINSKGVFWTLIIGELIGISKFLIEKFIDGNNIQLVGMNWIFSINYLHFTIILFLISTFLLFAISYITSQKEIKISNSVNALIAESLNEIKYEVKNFGSVVNYRVNILYSVIILFFIIGIWSFLS